MPAGNTSRMACPDYCNVLIGPVATRVVRNGHGRRDEVAALVCCANGLSFALRVGEKRACWPRSGTGPWSRVEIVDLNRGIADLRAFRQDGAPWSPTSGPVYTEVPVDLVNRVIARNGGLDKRVADIGLCKDCHGRGWRWVHTGGRAASPHSNRRPCDNCHGIGRTDIRRQAFT